MKLLAVSHSCVVPVNQQLFVSLNRLPGVEMELVVPAAWRDEYSGKRRPPSFLPTISFPVHRLPVVAPGQLSLHFYRRGLARVMEEARADVLFLDEEPWSLATAQVARLAVRMRIPYVCYTKQNIRKQYPPPFRRIEQATYRSAATIIALSEEVREVLRAKGYRGPSPLLAHACDLSLFQPRSSDLPRERLGLNGTVIGYMGRLAQEKGLNTLIEAAARLRREAPEAEVMVVLVGSGPEEQRLRRQAARAGMEGRVVFTGAVPHLRAGELMSCTDIFVLPSRTTPSWKEQFGRVVIEAMACEVPVIGSDSGQIPFLIEDTGGGMVFAEGNATDLTRALRVYLDDPAARVRDGKTGAAAVRARYTYEAIARALAEILMDAALTGPTLSGSTSGARTG